MLSFLRRTVFGLGNRTMGIGDRVGSLKVGYDADVVVWDRDPLLLGARPAQVIVDGHVCYRFLSIPLHC
jgi:imidazolonepropionase-like amidohydrolase